MLALESVMEPAVINPDTPVVRGVDDVEVTPAKPDVWMVVGLSRMHDLGFSP